MKDPIEILTECTPDSDSTLRCRAKVQIQRIGIVHEHERELWQSHARTLIGQEIYGEIAKRLAEIAPALSDSNSDPVIREKMSDLLWLVGRCMDGRFEDRDGEP